MAIYKLGRWSVESSSTFTKRFMTNHIEGMKWLTKKKNEGLAVMAASHRNFYYGSFPLSILEGINATRNTKLFEECRNRVDANGMVYLKDPQFEDAGRFEKQFNYFRGLKPAEVSPIIDMNIDASYTGESPYIKAEPEEVFMSGNIKMQTEDKVGLNYDLFYNLFPFAPFHFLLVPQKLDRINQFLGGENRKYLKLAWKFLMEAEEPYLRMAFNSLGAYASQNHLHFQCFFIAKNEKGKTNLPPIEKINLKHESTELENWPIKFGRIFRGDNALDNAFKYIESLHVNAKQNLNKIAFNLYLNPGENMKAGTGSITVLPRKHQAELRPILGNKEDIQVESEDMLKYFSTGPAWIELLGSFIIPNEYKFRKTREENIEKMLINTSLEQSPFTEIEV